MSRLPVLVRDAVDGDAATLCDLWHDLVVRPGMSGPTAPPEEVIRQALTRVDGDRSSRVLVAELDGEVVGCAFVRTAPTSPLHDESAVWVTHLQVDPAHARQGAGRALVTAALGWGESLGVESLLVASPPNDREVNRIFARMGLAQVAAMRGAPVTALRARLPHDPSAAVRQQTRGRRVGQVGAARRSQRRARAGRLAT